MTKEVRDYLIWSWNYSVAELMEEETTRHKAQWIASGVQRGQDATDDDLIRDWLNVRIADLDALALKQPTQWQPEFSWEVLVNEVRSFPGFGGIVEALKRERFLEAAEALEMEDQRED